MTPEIRQQAVQSRAAHYYDVMRTTFFTFAAVAAIDAFGGGGYSAPLTMLVVGVTAYGVLAGGTALQDIQGLSEDMDEEDRKTHYGQGVQSRNFGALRMTSAVLITLVGIAELYSIFV